METVLISLVYKFDGIEVGYGTGSNLLEALARALECCPYYPEADLLIEVTHV